MAECLKRRAVMQEMHLEVEEAEAVRVHAKLPPRRDAAIEREIGIL